VNTTLGYIACPRHGHYCGYRGQYGTLVARVAGRVIIVKGCYACKHEPRTRVNH
jgi:hypothetical protein